MPNYQWRKDRQGNVLDEPQKINDHAIDALCYGIYGVRGALSKNRPTGNFSDEIYFY